MSPSQAEKENTLDVMFSEALQAARAGERDRARDLLTRLLKVRQDRVDYWIWMSAVVETPKEKVFCLKEAARLDPQNGMARRGLILLGAMPPDESLVVPGRLQKRAWQPRLPGDSPAEGRKRPAISPMQIGLMGVALVAVVGLVAFAIWGAQERLRPRRRPVINLPTLTAVAAVEATPSMAPTLSGSPVPLWMRLEATYTPTPLYVNTPHSISEAYRIGLRAFERGEYKNADNHFRQAATDVAKSNQGSLDILYYVAENLRMQGELEDALEVYQQVIEQDPNFAPAYLGRARVLLEQDEEGQAQNIIADLRTAVSKDPGFEEASLELARILIEMDRAEEALAALAPTSALPRDSALASMYRAQAYLLMEDAASALESARRANERDVTLLLPYRIMGEAMQLLGDVVGSQEPLQVYLQYETGDPQAWLLLGKANLALDRLPDALKALDQAIRLDSRLPGVYLLRADLQFELENPEKALTDYQAALRVDPESYQASLGAGKALMALGYPGDAWDRFERTRSLAGTAMQKSELLFWRGQSLEALGEIDAALRDYQALVDLPGSAVQKEWVDFAKARIAAIVTPTPSASRTRTPRAGKTPTPTATKKP